MKLNISFNFSINTADIIKGMPKPIEYTIINVIPFNISCCFAINSRAALKNVPIHGVQLIENSIPNTNDLIKFRFLVSAFICLLLFKNFGFIIYI